VSVTADGVSVVAHIYVPTTEGLLVATSLVSRIEEPISDEALGEFVVDALGKGGFVQPHPSREEMRAWPGKKELFKVARVRSARQWYRDRLEVAVREDVDGEIRVWPSVNEGPRRGFAPVKGDTKWVAPRDDSPLALGVAVREAFAMSSIAWEG